MVKPNLTIGAIFEDGGLYYQVQSVLPNGNYISKMVEKPTKAPKETPKETPQEEPVRKSTRGRKK